MKNKNDHATGYIQVRAHVPQTNVYGVVPLRLSVNKAQINKTKDDDIPEEWCKPTCIDLPARAKENSGDCMQWNTEQSKMTSSIIRGTVYKQIAGKTHTNGQVGHESHHITQLHVSSSDSKCQISKTYKENR